MTVYSFYNKTADDIADEFLELIEGNDATAKVNAAFLALTYVSSDVYRAVVDRLEQKLIEQAKIYGAAWLDLESDIYEQPTGMFAMDEREAEKLALLDNLQRLRPMAEAFVRIFAYKGSDLSKPLTIAVKNEFSTLPERDKNSVEKMAAFFADLHVRLDDPSGALAAERAVRASIAAFHQTAVNSQQKLKALSQARKKNLTTLKVK